MDIVERLYHQLARALERGYPGAPDRAPTIGDIYQHLIPYRAMRSELGIWELPEYEHALVRLLVGERGHLVIEDSNVRDELLRELASPNPILGIYRDYAAVPVRIGATDAAPPPPPTPPDTPATPPPEPPPAPEPTPAATTEPEDIPAAPPAPAACRSCGAILPDVDGLRFCPSCGADQLEVHCRACDAVLRPEWNFCIRCGEPRDAARPRNAGGV